MPIPKPRPNERQDDFIGRCMGDDTMIRDYRSQPQRFAVCLSSWERDKKDSTDDAKKK